MVAFCLLLVIGFGLLFILPACGVNAFDNDDDWNLVLLVILTVFILPLLGVIAISAI